MTRTASKPDIDLAFPHSWTAEVLPMRPLIAPARQFVYPGQADEVERGALELLVKPADADAFLATCALGFADPSAPTGIWSCPHPDWLCAVSGGYAYLIDTVHPERFVHLRYRPVLQLESYLPADKAPSEGLLLFIGHHTILAWNRDGEAWESDRLSWEGVT